MVIKALKTTINQCQPQPAAQAERDRFFRLSLDMVGIVGFDGYFKRLNPMWEKTLSLASSELLLKPLIEGVHPEDRETTGAALQALATDSSDAISFENRYRTADGSYVRLFWNAATVIEEQAIYAVVRAVAEPAAEGANGNGLGQLERGDRAEFKTSVKYRGVQLPAPSYDELEKRIEERTAGLTSANTLLKQEIAKRQEAEQQLRQSEERFRSYFELSSIGVAISSPDKNWLEINDYLCNMLGYSRAELLHKTWSEVTHADDILAEEAQFLQVLDGYKDGYFTEKRFIRKDGLAIDVSLSVRCVRQADGTVDYLIGLVQDISDRKRAASAEKRLIASLRESETRLRLALKAARMGVWDWNILSGQVTWTEGTEALFDLPPGGFGGTYYAFINLFHPEDRSGIMLALARAVEAGADYNIEKRIIGRDGNVRWILSNAEVLYDPTGKPARTIGTVRDVTERKKAQESLKQANEELEVRVEARTAAFRHAIGQLHGEIAERKHVEERLRNSQEMLQLVMDNIPQLIAWKDGDSRYLGCNRSMAKVVGLNAPEQIVGKSDYDLPWNQEEADYFRSCDRRVMETDAPEYHVIESQLQADGKVAWLDKNRIPLHDSAGKVVGILLTSEDITDRQLASEALQRSEAEKTQLIASLQEQATQLKTALHTLKQTQTQLIQNEKMSSLGQLVAGVAHEINNPVNFIYGNINYANEYIRDLLKLVQVYQQHYPQPPDAVREAAESVDIEFLKADLPKLLDSMKMGSERIREIVRSLRNFSRLDESQRKPVDIHEGIDNTLMILHHRMKTKGGLFGIEAIREYDKLPKVECYPGQLNQVFMNILVNAIDALENQPKQGVITIRTLVVNGEGGLESGDREFLIPHPYIVVRISDNGPGMNELVRQRMFDPFFTTKPVGKGTGLGLSISYQIVVEKHHGSLQCFSTPGQGTELAIAIPIRQPTKLPYSDRSRSASL